MSGTKATALVAGAHRAEFIWNTIIGDEGRDAVFPQMAERRA